MKIAAGPVIQFKSNPSRSSKMAPWRSPAFAVHRWIMVRNKVGEEDGGRVVDMPSEVTSREDRQIIHVELHGELTGGDLDGVLRAVIEFSRNGSLLSVFVNATSLTSLPSTMEIYHFGSQLSRNARGMRVAIVTSEEARRDLTFLETVALNRGVRIRICDSAAVALKWLAVNQEAPFACREMTRSERD